MFRRLLVCIHPYFQLSPRSYSISPRLFRANLNLMMIMLLIIVSSCSHSQSKKAEALKNNLRKYPELMDARIKTLWVPDKIEGNRWTEGHFIFVIDQPTMWQVK